jgi:hypothetical protein
MILGTTSSDRSTFVVNENYVATKRAFYKGLCIHYHISNSRFNDGSPRATPPATA